MKHPFFMCPSSLVGAPKPLGVCSGVGVAFAICNKSLLATSELMLVRCLRVEPLPDLRMRAVNRKAE